MLSGDAAANEKFWEDRRSHLRVSTELTVEYRIIGEDGKSSTDWNVTRTKNVSAAGVYFESYYPLGLNTILEIKLNAPSFKTPMMLKGRIVRAEEIQTGEIYGVAAAIMHVTEQYRKQLQQALEQIDVSTLLQIAFEQGASDVYLSGGCIPLLRKGGKIIPAKADPLHEKTVKKMIFSILTKEEVKQFCSIGELQIADTIAGIYNFRLNSYMQSERVEANFHLIKVPIPEISSLLLPKTVISVIEKLSGLVVITGAPRSGKTTTALALLSEINKNRACIIMTVENPVEYKLYSSNGIIRQVQVDLSKKTYAEHVQTVVERYAPEVLMVRDIPDAQTLELCLNAAANDCLVIVEVVASHAGGALAKLVSLAVSERQFYVSQLISECLQLVVAQKLVPSKKIDDILSLATEVLVSTPEVVNKIRNGNFNELSKIIEDDTKFEMQSFEQSLKKL